MKKIIKLVVFVTALLLLGGCDSDIGLSARSGSMDDDYVAEPLGVLAKKYEHALTVSNRFIDYVIAADYDPLYNEIFDADLRKLISKEKFEESMSRIEDLMGKIKGYKSQQWGFFSRTDNGVDYLYSIKIVEYEKGMMKFLIVFRNDGKYQTVLGFQAKERKGTTPPGVF